MGEASLQCLARTRKLGSLRVHRATLTADEYRYIASRQDLRVVTLLDCDLGGDGLDQLAKLKTLFLLELSGSAFSEAAVAHLSQMRDLKGLDVTRTKLTRKDVEKLRGALPNCRIQSDFGSFPTGR